MSARSEAMSAPPSARARDRLAAGFLMLLMGVGSLMLWLGIPVALLWFFSKVTDSWNGHFLLSLTLIPAAMALFAPVLFWLVEGLLGAVERVGRVGGVECVDDALLGLREMQDGVGDAPAGSCRRAGPLRFGQSAQQRLEPVLLGSEIVHNVHASSIAVRLHVRRTSRPGDRVRHREVTAEESPGSTGQGGR